jgi:hypothetical protein
MQRTTIYGPAVHLSTYTSQLLWDVRLKVPNISLTCRQPDGCYVASNAVPAVPGSCNPLLEAAWCRRPGASCAFARSTRRLIGDEGRHRWQSSVLRERNRTSNNSAIPGVSSAVGEPARTVRCLLSLRSDLWTDSLRTPRWRIWQEDTGMRRACAHTKPPQHTKERAWAIAARSDERLYIQ